mmetsp:Transcript_40202/g.89205  ORF Transcript_40202/g.89205 Transcript_40202/m.89205 type:complete len:164 (-) Transcript_40202:809-1300(-)
MQQVVSSSSLRGASSQYCAPRSFRRQPARLSVSVRAAFDKLVKKPDLKKPERPEEPVKKLFNDSPVASPASTTTAESSAPRVITIEYQRQRAKEMNKYFKELKLQEQITKAQVFGWTPANEINNGRWVMFGLLVGMLTEYATGVDFIDQLKLTLTYLGIADVE